MQISFITPTVISPLDFTSMGDSSKRDKPDKIGQFDSGLKYAIAILLRHGVDINVQTLSNDQCHMYTFDTYTTQCGITQKQKELITIFDHSTSREYRTGFAKNLGFDWELWMALRELWSNCLDEGGTVSIDTGVKTPENAYTVFTLECSDDSEFAKVVDNSEEYILNSSQYQNNIYGENYIFKSKDGQFRIYKHGILVYHDPDKKSYFNFNIDHGKLDERRILLDHHSVFYNLVEKMVNCGNEQLYEQLVKSQPFLDKDDALNQIGSIWNTPAKYLIDCINQHYVTNGEVYTFNALFKKAKEQPGSPLPGRIIKTVTDSIFAYSSNVEVTAPKEDVKTDLKSIILSKYNIPLEFDIKVAYIVGQNVVADKFNNVLLVTEDFDIDKDFPTFIIELISLTQKGNILLNMGAFLQNTLRKC